MKITNPALPLKDRDNALFAVVDQANQVISIARSSAPLLDQEAFKSGELEFYNHGMVTGIVDAVSLILQNYASARPKVADAAAQRLDGPEVQNEVELQIAIADRNQGDDGKLCLDRDPAQEIKAGLSVTDNWIFLPFVVFCAKTMVFFKRGRWSSCPEILSMRKRANADTSCVTGLPARVRTPFVPSFFSAAKISSPDQSGD